ERRLCFVGITRAQERLIMAKAAYRTIRGIRERTVASPFLREMPADAVEAIDRTGLDFREPGDREIESRGSRFRAGQLVRHPTFGVGRIAELSPRGQDTRVVVMFNAVGRKTLMLQIARLEAVG